MTSTDFWVWFEAQVAEKFPDRASLLPRGATKKAIKHAESLMRVELPSEVKNFYKRHDGSGPFCFHPWVIGGGEQWFVSLDRMASTWKTMCKIGEDFERTEPDYGFGTQEGPIKRKYWSPRYVPITENQCGDNIVMDFDPADGGTIGQMVDWWHEGGVSKWVSPSFLGWLHEIRNAVDKGKMQIGA